MNLKMLYWLILSRMTAPLLRSNWPTDRKFELHSTFLKPQGFSQDRTLTDILCIIYDGQIPLRWWKSRQTRSAEVAQYVVAEGTSADDIRQHLGYSQSGMTRQPFARSNGGYANNLVFNYKTRIGASSLSEQDDADRDWVGPVSLEIPVDVPCGDGFLRTKDRFLISLWREEGYYCADDILGLRISEAAQTYDEILDSIYETLGVSMEGIRHGRRL